MEKTDAKTAMEELTMMLIYLSHFTEQDRFLKCHADEDKLDSRFLRLHKELFPGYDCSKCRNY